MSNIVLPDTIGPLKINQSRDENSCITKVDAWLVETTGDILAVRFDHYFDGTEAYVPMIWTHDDLRYMGMVKRVVGTYLQAATEAGYKSVEFRSMMSTAEVAARGAKVISPTVVQIDLDPPGAFAKWLAGELKQLV